MKYCRLTTRWSRRRGYHLAKDLRNERAAAQRGRSADNNKGKKAHTDKVTGAATDSPSVYICGGPLVKASEQRHEFKTAAAATRFLAPLGVQYWDCRCRRGDADYVRRVEVRGLTRGNPLRRLVTGIRGRFR